MEAVVLLFMGAAVWWYRPTKWRVVSEEAVVEEIEETEANKRREVVEVVTPEGRVTMRRRGDAFEYWAARSMAYKYLDPVARRHAMLYGGDYTKLERATVKEVKVEGVAGVFASLKTYGRREVCKEINKYKWLGREEEVVERKPARAVSFADFKNKKE